MSARKPTFTVLRGESSQRDAYASMLADRDEYALVMHYDTRHPDLTEAWRRINTAMKERRAIVLSQFHERTSHFNRFLKRARNEGYFTKVIRFPTPSSEEDTTPKMQPWNGESWITMDAPSSSGGKVVKDVDEEKSTSDAEEEGKGERLIVLRSGTGPWGRATLDPLIPDGSRVFRAGSAAGYRRVWPAFLKALRQKKTTIVLDMPNTLVRHFTKYVKSAEKAGYEVEVWRMSFSSRDEAWANTTRDIPSDTFERIQDELDRSPFDGEVFFEISEDGFPVPCGCDDDSEAEEAETEGEDGQVEPEGEDGQVDEGASEDGQAETEGEDGQVDEGASEDGQVDEGASEDGQVEPEE